MKKMLKMFRGGHASTNPDDPEPKNPPEKEDPTILITQFVSPQQFSYVRRQDVEAYASLVSEMEKALAKYCTQDKKESMYLVNQNVIVQYKPVSPPKLLRGVVKKQEDEDYLVWILDYGFTLCCSPLDMWPLPEPLTRTIWDVLDGSIAYICPRNGSNWSIAALRVFDKLMEEAIHLKFDVVCQGQVKQNFGKLLFKTAGPGEAFQDGAEFLLAGKHASPQPFMDVMLETSFSEAFSFELAEINDPMIDARPRVKNILQLVASANPSSPSPTHIPQLTSEQKPAYSTVSFDIVKVLGKSEPWDGEPSKNTQRNLTRPLEQVPKLDKKLDFRTDVTVPESARLLRSQVSPSNGECVVSALIRHSSEIIDTDGSDYEDAQLPRFWKTPKLPSRPSSPASSQDSFVTTQRATDEMYDSDSDVFHDFPSAMTKSLPKVPPREPLETTSACRNVVKKSEVVEAAPIPSSSHVTTKGGSSSVPASGVNHPTLYKEKLDQNVIEKSERVEAAPIPSSSLVTTKGGSSSVPENGVNHPKEYKEKLDRIYNEFLGNRSNVLPIVPKDIGNRAVLGGIKATKPQNIVCQRSNVLPNVAKDIGNRAFTESQTIVSPSGVLAHSPAPVHPVASLAELPFGMEIRKSISDLNIHSMLPTQLYAWPHLLNGGSLVLVNGCGSGRSWSYLPVLCSTVFHLMENSGYSSGSKLGPLAILLVDSKSRASALASDCSFLMPNSSDPEQYNVVNTHGYSMSACQMMLLSSCGILVTTPDHLLDLLSHEMAMIDPKRLAYFILDDFDRLRQTSPQLLDAVLQKLKGLSTGPTMQLVVVAQQWHKKFEKLLRHTARPLALFGDFLEAAIYGDLRMKFSMKAAELKKELLLTFLAKQKAFKRRTLIYCKYERELSNLHGILTRAGHECIGFYKAHNQQPHQVLLLSDEVDQLKIPVQNIEVLIHFSLPLSWSKFVKRFQVLADQIPNFFTNAREKKQPLVSYLMLDDSNSREFQRLTKFLQAHDLAKDQIPWTNCQSPKDESIPYCPYLLSWGECPNMPCIKRHDFLPADMPTPGNPLLQPGTVVRCKLYKTYDPGHLAVWPLEYKTKGSAVWVDAPHPVNQWIAAVEMSMGTKRTVHKPYRLDDVCIVHHQGHFKRVKIVDTQPTQVTVQMMDYGTELMQVKAYQLLQCPEQKFRTLPPLAMDIRLSGVTAGEGKRMTEATQWVQEAFGTLSDRQQMQLIVDFAMLNVVYAKEVTVVEECPSMRTSVYKLLLRKELVGQGFAQMHNQNVEKLRQMQEQQAKVKEESEANKENIQQATWKAHPDPKEPTNIPEMASKGKKPEPVKVAENRLQIKQEYGENKELPANEATIKVEASKEDMAPTSTKAESDQASTSTAAFYKALMHELYTKSPSKKQETRDFIQSILDGSDEAINEKIPTARRELKLEDVPQAATPGPSAKPVAQSLPFSAVKKGAVRPRVKWYQTRSHIELSFEQQAPEYQLWLEGNTLFYFVSSTSPPQQCVLPLLREVRLVSEKQHGYYLKVKLAKIGVLTDWPTLLSSAYAQQNARWLTYDTERAEEPGPPASLLMWERYSRHQQLKDYEEYEDEEDDDEFNSEIYEEGVDRSDTARIYEDF